MKWQVWHTVARVMASFLVGAVAWLGAGSVAHGACVVPAGDLTGDGRTNVVDVQCEIVNVLWHQLGAVPGQMPICLAGEPSDADTNCDEQVNVSDALIVITLALDARLDPIIDFDGDGCPKTCEAECVPEGEAFPIVPGAPECCEGLVPVGCSMPDPEGECSPCVGASYCTACGDGICGPGENICRCPQDCTPVALCWSNQDCKANAYCSFPGCAAETGVCKRRPSVCPDVWDPVCGCDGTTYGNACEAAMAGESVDYEGECIEPLCWNNDMCPPDEYCYFWDCGLKSGVCMPRPTLCPTLWDPVCGCDGMTYANKCVAAMQGVSVDYAGECIPAHCWSNDMCPASMYCYFAECAMESGVCKLIPEACPDVWIPVCGCDGQTYANACYAAMAGMSVDYVGMCKPVYCWGNEMCEDSQYCYFAECALETGVCKPRPTACPFVWDPVCGCDGKTYANACIAAAQGMSVDYEGECKSIPCMDNSMCPNGMYCFFEECEYDSGICKQLPSGCPDVWEPVCGCDEVTYSNSCYAAMAGMSVDYEGECLSKLCWGNEMCDKDEYCYFAHCAMLTGKCVERPTLCPPLWEPVCGCNDVTYANACVAAMQGMSVNYAGKCIK